ncbi:MAG: nucleotidyltransferase domain-containing protein [Phycisphaeraceae bacterium]
MVRNALIESRRGELERLCRAHHVRRLDLFGSVARDDFDPQQSDLDLIVEFDDQVVRSGFQGDYFTLLTALEDLFGRPVDLIEPDGIRNPLFRAEVEQTRQPIYEA